MTTRADHNTRPHAKKAARRPGWSSQGRRVALAALGLLALSACQGDSGGFIPGCPNVGILRDAGTLRITGPDGNQQATAVMSSLGASCAYGDDGVTVNARLGIVGEAQAGYAAGAIPLDYFVVVTDPERNVIAKQVFGSTIALNGGQGAVIEDLQQFIPAPRTVDARWYEVLVGFQLPPEQAITNRMMNEAR